MLENSEETGPTRPETLILDTSEDSLKTSSEEYELLQRRIFLIHIVLSAFAVSITFFLFDFYFSLSLFLGSFAGIIYLRLLAKSIGKLGNEANSVSKFQLLVPVLLVLVVSKTPQLELIPALLGFLLYKLSLILQVMLES